MMFTLFRSFSRGEYKIIYLNEGTRVSVLQNQGSWVEIVLLSGEKAWIPIEKIKVI